MKKQLKNWLLLNNINCFFIKKQKALVCLLFFCYLKNNSQIANYVTNGGFDSLIDIISPNREYKAIGWSGVDSTKYTAELYNLKYGGGVPNSGVSYQWPKSGTGYIRVTCYLPSGPVNFKRSNIKNRLKQTLIAGKTYCVKMYVNVLDQVYYGIDAFGFYFGDNTVDTIKYNSRLPLTFLNPQVQNPMGNIIIDTMNWVPITGTFVANGNEKFMVLANFKSDVNTNLGISNSSVPGNVGCEFFIDDVSCIPTDLPAYAGFDTYALPGNTVYIGRPQDVGIDEACVWYNLSNTTTPIANLAGITVTVAATTQTYMVKQDICGIIKYDTVVVYASAVGFNELKIKNDNVIKVYPNPTTGILNIEAESVASTGLATKIKITNVLGILVKEEELKISTKNINLCNLQTGIYFLQIFDKEKLISNTKIIKK